LHASASLFPGGVVAFLGHSTSGKSTIAAKLQTKYEMVSDDGLFVFQKDGQWFCANGDCRDFNLGWHKNGRISLSSRFEAFYPIRLFARIWQQSAVYYLSLDVIKLCKYLMDAFMEVDIQRRLPTSVKKGFFESIAALARATAGCNLYFEKNSCIDRIEKVLFHMDPGLFQKE